MDYLRIFAVVFTTIGVAMLIFAAGYFLTDYFSEKHEMHKMVIRYLKRQMEAENERNREMR